MKITLLCVGKTEEKYLNEGIEIYLKRLKHYIKLETIEIPELKNTKGLSQEQQKTSGIDFEETGINRFCGFAGRTRTGTFFPAICRFIEQTHAGLNPKPGFYHWRPIRI